MSDQAALWAIFILLWVALVVVIVGAHQRALRKPLVRIIHEGKLHSVSMDAEGGPDAHLEVVRESWS